MVRLRPVLFAVIVVWSWGTFAGRVSAQPSQQYYWGNQGADAGTAGNWTTDLPPTGSYNPAAGSPGTTTALNFVPYSYGAIDPINPNIGLGQSAFSATFAPNFQLGGWTLTGNSGSELTLGNTNPTGLTTYGPTAVAVSDPNLAGTSTNKLTLTITTGSTLALTGQTAAVSNLTTTVTSTPPAAAITFHGGTFRLDNTLTNLTDRIANTAGVAASGGAFEYVGNSAGSTETLESILLFAGSNSVRVTHTSSSAATVLTFKSLLNGNTANGMTGNLDFSSIGGSLGSGVNPRVLFTTAPTLQNGVIKLTASTGYVTVNGTGFATYDATAGITAVATTDISGTLTTSPTSNARLTGDGTFSDSADLVLNTLKIDPSAAGQSLSITGSGSLNTGAILLAGTRDFTIQNTGGGTGGLTGGTAGAARFIHVANPDTTLNVGVALGTIGPLVKAGDGFLSLTGTSSQIGATDYTINAGTLRASMTNFPNATGGLRLRGGVLEITGGSNGTGVSADFTRAISTTSATGLNWTGTTISDRGSGGFSAFGSNASVNIGGSASPTTLTWNSGNFVADGYALIFGSSQSNARLTFLNPIALGTPATSQGYGLREFRVIDNPNSTSDLTTLAGAITGSDARVDLLKTGGGTLELTATNTYTGATLATGGTLRLAGASGKLATSSFNLGNGTVFEIDNSANNLSGRLTASGGPKLTLGGAAVRLVGNNSSTASETFNGLTLNPGSSSIAATNANATISLGNITRNTAGGTVSFSTTGTINTSASLTNGIIGGYATIGDDWATTSGSQVVAYSGYVLSSSAAASTWTATDNVKVVDAQSLLASGQAYSANFAGGSLTTAAGRTFTVGSGGILATASGSITGGVLTANNAAQGSDIIATVNGSNVFTIGSTISDNGGAVGLTKSGTGTLVLTGTNLYTGRTTIGQGMLAGTGTVSGAATVLSGAVIRGGTTGTTGTLTVANSLTFVKGATLQVEASRTGAGTANASKIDVTGDGHVLNLNPGSIVGERIAIDLVSNASNPLLLNETYTLTLASVPAAGNIRLNGVTLPDNAVIDPKLYSLHSADFSNFSNVSLAIDNSGQNLLLTFTPVPVPEPASVVALAAGGLFAVRIVRRRKPGRRSAVS